MLLVRGLDLDIEGTAFIVMLTIIGLVGFIAHGQDQNGWLWAAAASLPTVILWWTDHLVIAMLIVPASYAAAWLVRRVGGAD